jgi:hypothetical protein
MSERERESLASSEVDGTVIYACGTRKTTRRPTLTWILAGWRKPWNQPASERRSSGRGGHHPPGTELRQRQKPEPGLVVLHDKHTLLSLIQFSQSTADDEPTTCHQYEQ